MLDHEFEYAPENSNIKRYNYKYLRLQGMEFCKVNWGKNNLSKLLLNFLEMKNDEYCIVNIDLEDCMGAIMFQVSLGYERFNKSYDLYKEAFVKKRII